MDHDDIDRRFDELNTKLDKVEGLARETHDCVIRLETRVGGLREPGECHTCQQHLERLAKVESDLAGLTTRFWFAYGGALVLLAALQFLVSHYLKK